jgi:NADP-dependent 3-hydroxy acid dehydrogenase YdfG
VVSARRLRSCSPERGAKLVLGARGLDRLEALAAGIANQGGEVSCAPTDVRRRDEAIGFLFHAGLVALAHFHP